MCGESERGVVGGGGRECSHVRPLQPQGHCHRIGIHRPCAGAEEGEAGAEQIGVVDSWELDAAMMLVQNIAVCKFLIAYVNALAN